MRTIVGIVFLFILNACAGRQSNVRSLNHDSVNTDQITRLVHQVRRLVRVDPGSSEAQTLLLDAARLGVQHPDNPNVCTILRMSQFLLHSSYFETFQPNPHIVVGLTETEPSLMRACPERATEAEALAREAMSRYLVSRNVDELMGANDSLRNAQVRSVTSCRASEYTLLEAVRSAHHRERGLARELANDFVDLTLLCTPATTGATRVHNDILIP